MPGIYEHILFRRESGIRERRGKSFPPPKFEGNPKEHSQKLFTDIQNLRKQRDAEISGYDKRLLLKINIRENFDPQAFETIPGIELISQEDKEIVLLFAAEEALADFENRLTAFGSSAGVTRKQLIEATKAIHLWTPEDRKGEALKREGVPESETFIIDTELWSIEKAAEQKKLFSEYKLFLEKNDIKYIDSVANNYLNVVRVRCNKNQLNLLLKYRDIRTADLPPKFYFDISLLQTNIENLPQPLPPDESAPKIAVLDSGLNSGHPLLKQAVGEKRTYISETGSHDDTGHGTAVASIVLYDNISDAINSKTFKAPFWILSGRVLDENNEYNEKFIENQIDKAVREFHHEYGCRIFNVSLGDTRRPFTGGRAGSFTLTLDNLSHELGILFIVPSGNYDKRMIQENLKNKIEFPDYLFNDGQLLEPANALNAITVGSMARYDKGRAAHRYSDDPAYQPVVRAGEISPFSRTGPGLLKSIKPELISYGGNMSSDRDGMLREHGLGEIAFNHDFLSGKLFNEYCGTSFSAPRISHLAGRLLADIKNAPVHLVRALLIGQANYNSIFFRPQITETQKKQLSGYGKVEEDFLFRSGEETVVIYAHDFIENNKNHFYQLPLPDEYFAGKRRREITVTLSYFSAVRNTRISYKATRMFYKFVKSNSAEEVYQMFDKGTPDDEYSNIPEYSHGRWITSKERTNGTVQSSTWILKASRLPEKYFIVVTRNDYPWGERISKLKEEYVLAVIIRDKENQEAQLYTKIRNAVRERARGRI
ncbi:MAG: S8 family peptidase [Spirochaetia bacterium]|nr:S8 family peptidase [Spirochaetia bacterium]